jgi:hypothetical protein
MTLIITEISEYGIAMVADRALTETFRFRSGREYAKTLDGVHKLQPIPSLEAGISMWGRATFPTSGGEAPLDLWLRDFIHDNSSLTSLDDFAEKLTNELKLSLGGTRDLMGFHIAGYVDSQGRKMPTVYHVRNNDGPYGQLRIHDFVKGHDFPPRDIRSGETFELRNGDFGPYALLSETIKRVGPTLQQVSGLAIPYPSLEGRLSYQAAWIRFISDIYDSSRALRTIGTSVIRLGIAPDGRIKAYQL